MQLPSLLLFFGIISPGLSRILSNVQCDAKSEFKANTVIRIKESLQGGAIFLQKLTVNSMHECYFSCCQLSTCTTAVYNAKIPKRCFLFECGQPNQCVYTKRQGYDVIVISDHQPIQKDAKLGEPCDRHVACLSDHSICSDGLCICQSGWQKKGDVCVPSVCKSPELQFQCNDSSTCVAIYDRCNGVVECPDASDEANCPIIVTTSPTLINTQHNLAQRLRSAQSSNYTIPSSAGPSFRKFKRFRNDLNRDSADESSRTNSRLEELSDDGLFEQGNEEWLQNLSKQRYPRFIDRDSPKRRGRLAFDGGGEPKYRSLSHFDISPDNDDYDRQLLHDVRSPRFVDVDYMEPPESFEGDMIDSSVFNPPRRRHNFRGSRRLFASGPQKVSASEHRSMDRRSDHSEVKNRDSGGTKPSLVNVWSATNAPALSVLQQNASQRHTATLVMAFSLGLVGCFVIVIICEWRRRVGRPSWISRRRPARVTIPFTNREKIPHRDQFVRLRQASDDEDEDKRLPVYNGQVL